VASLLPPERTAPRGEGGDPRGSDWGSIQRYKQSIATALKRDSDWLRMNYREKFFLEAVKAISLECGKSIQYLMGDMPHPVAKVTHF
jgi:hypothetical protein